MEISEQQKSILQQEVETIGLKFEQYKNDILSLKDASESFQKYIEEQDLRFQKQLKSQISKLS